MKAGTRGELYWKQKDVALGAAVKEVLSGFMEKHYGLPVTILTREQGVGNVGNIPVQQDDSVTPGHFWLVIG